MKILTQENLKKTPNWLDLIETLKKGHLYPKPQIDDVFQKSGPVTLLSRSAFIEGFGCGTKTVTVASENSLKGLPTVQGAMICFDAINGTPTALVESALITKWKTASDSVLGAKLLARPNPKVLLIVGAGAVAQSLVEAYTATFPILEKIWVYNRTEKRAKQLVSQLSNAGFPLEFAPDLADACADADIISTATMATEPVLKGDWINPGTHIDLIGAFKADMREADDVLLKKGRIFVDNFDTTIDHIGELKIPIAAGIISPSDILGDLYDLVPDSTEYSNARSKGRTSDDEITIFKNGGGAHLDLMTAHYLINLAQNDQNS